ncbi:hypothetical protein [Pseudoruegeria sp. SK021]|uniref:hypothetical protein n=1 Tax=Pseudoruegeria sp. SK021 TaxID=1933035 RepID=UPI000A22CBFD|nr:hypothetical protein [Pseudoruegeria sp. SK021]OSP53480.1 hypothetical protein BV911_17750 [Pseudoruegeria sp. SK021]
MNKPGFSSAVLGAVAAIAAPAWADDEATAWRLFVADHTSPTTTAIDLDDPEQRWNFDVAGPAKLYPAASEALVIAVQSDNERVEFPSRGLSLNSHGDHFGSSIASAVPVAEDAAPPRVGIGSFAADGTAVGEMQICTVVIAS